MHVVQTSWTQIMYIQRPGTRNRVLVYCARKGICKWFWYRERNFGVFGIDTTKLWVDLYVSHKRKRCAYNQYNMHFSLYSIEQQMSNKLQFKFKMRHNPPHLIQTHIISCWFIWFFHCLAQFLLQVAPSILFHSSINTFGAWLYSFIHGLRYPWGTSLLSTDVLLMAASGLGNRI